MDRDRIRWPIRRFNVSFITRSTLTLRASLKSCCRPASPMRPIPSSRLTTISTSLSSVCSPRTYEPNTPISRIGYSRRKSGCICRNFPITSSSVLIGWARVTRSPRRLSRGVSVKRLPQALCSFEINYQLKFGQSYSRGWSRRFERADGLALSRIAHLDVCKGYGARGALTGFTCRNVFIVPELIPLAHNWSRFSAIQSNVCRHTDMG
jgi:hypothetical protein